MVDRLEEYARSAEAAAVNSAASAKRSADAALQCSAAVGRMERELGDLKIQVINRIDGLNARVKALETNGTEAPAQQQQQKPARRQLDSITEDEWSDSPTGHHVFHTKKVKKSEFLQWKREQDEHDAATKWKKQWKWVRWIVVGLVGGLLYGIGEQLSKWLAHHV